MDVILCLNAGSTNIKAAVHEQAHPTKRVAAGGAQKKNGELLVRMADGDTQVAGPADVPAAIRNLIGATASALRVMAVAHRIVHGGPDYMQPAALEDALEQELRALIPLAPLHQPAGLDLAGAARRTWPDAVHVACFDTAFHASLPELERTLPLPADVRGRGYRRYGFHGLSFEHVARTLASERPDLRRVVVAHLGGGSSLCALSDGRSVATTMGMTPLDGLPMTTRSGAIDPGAVLAMAREIGIDATEAALYRRSGLAGLAGQGGDWRRLNEGGGPEAAFAIDLFAERVAQGVAALTVPLGGLQALFFTGGIGANDAEFRDRVTRRLRHLPAFETLHGAADEEAVMARQAAELIKASAAASG